MKRNTKPVFKVISILLFVFSSGTISAQGPYQFKVVDVPGGSGATTINNINDSGLIAGNFAELIEGFVATSDLSTVSILNFGNLFSYPGRIVAGLNNHGAIAGDTNHSGFYTTTPPYVDLTSNLSAGGYLTVVGIADDGTVAGSYSSSGPGLTVSPQGTVTTFTVDGLATSVNGINSSGQMTVGFTTATDRVSTPFIRTSGGAVSRFQFPGANLINPQCIDNNGNVAGFFGDLGGPIRGFWRSADGSINLVIDVPGATETRVLGMNNIGQLVGQFTDSDGAIHGFIATPNPGSDNAPPTLTTTGVTSGTPQGLLLALQDVGSGLKSVNFQIQGATISYSPFPPGTTTPVTITAYPQGFGSSLTVTAGDVAGTNIRFPTVSIYDAINGTVTFSLNSFNFAPHPAGQTGGPATVYIRNGLQIPIHASASLEVGKYFAITSTTCGAPIPAGGSCVIYFTFTSPGTGVFNDSINVSYDAAGGGLSLPISGSGLGTGLTLSPSYFEFAGHHVGETGGPGKVFLFNFGTTPIAILSATLTGSTDFRIDSTTCTATLEAHQTCSYSVTVTPSGRGYLSATLTVTSGWSGSPQTVLFQSLGY